MTKSIDEWAAEKCGVEVSQKDTTKPVFSLLPVFIYKGAWYQFEWTIKDPRCRSRFWQWWLSSDSKRRLVLTGQYVSCSELCGIDIAVNIIPGIDSDDAEIACITAIYEAENGSEE